MLLYRVFIHDPTETRRGKPGHATYVHRPQGASRWDNPHLYDAWYLATTPEGAIGETFGNFAEWTDAMIEHGSGLRRALATFSAPDDLSILDLDDPGNLAMLTMRPSQVVIRNKGYTQGKAADVFHEHTPAGERRWAGLSWWSFHRPHWRNLLLWGTPHAPVPLQLKSVEALALDSVAFTDAAAALRRPLP